MSLAEVIKNSLNHFKKSRDPITPDLYREIFCAEAKKLNIGIEDCEKIEKFTQKLAPEIKKTAQNYRIKNIDELIIFLISQANRNSPSIKSDSISNQLSLIRILLNTIEKLPYEPLKKDAIHSLSRDLNNYMILQDEKTKWQKNLANIDNLIEADNEPKIIDENKFNQDDIKSETDILSSAILELNDIVKEYDKNREKIIDSLEYYSEKQEFSSIIEKIKNIFARPKEQFDGLSDLQDLVTKLQSELEIAKYEANEDYITKTLNRRGLDNELSLLEANKTIYSIALLQIDKYESLISSLGIKSGEMIQRTIIDFIKSNIHNNIKLGRYAGNTFMLIIDKIPFENTKIIINNIIGSIPKKHFVYENKKFSVTLSASLTSRSDFQSLQEIISISDKLLSNAKNSGGNKVVYE